MTYPLKIMDEIERDKDHWSGDIVLTEPEWQSLRTAVEECARIADKEKRKAIASHLEGLHDHCPLNVQDGTRSVQDWLLEEADRIRPSSSTTGEQR